VTPVLFIGGIRSGKSGLALRWGALQGPRRLFVATCVPEDAQMRERVRRHQEERGTAWACIEEALHPEEALTRHLRESANPEDVVLLDCVSLWIAAMLSNGRSEDLVLKKVESLAACMCALDAAAALVTAEVGQCLAPVSELGRRFQDTLGAANQILAKRCDTVALVHCGLPLTLKGRLPEIP
jgi:adenosylcobinamide kinase/adenosylcobinamide-phosphate guanylyltransferase